MSYVYYLAGENPELGLAEINGFLESQGFEESASRTGRIVETESEPMQLKRLALTHEVSRKISEIEDIEDFRVEYRPEGSFAIRAENMTEGKDTGDIETELGEKISGKTNSVDLENPETVLKAYILEEKIVLGELIEDINRGLFGKRKNQNRPFSSPVSLDPVLARVLVNLTGVKPGENVLDPFCGTGGILIEAGLCGVGVHGLDVKEEMVSGTERNLEEYGIINHDIRQGEISEADEILGNGCDAIVTDLPYGKSSKETGNPVEDFLEFMEDFDGPVVFVWNREELKGYEANFSVYIHGSLTRYIYVLE
ncbi:MAG: methyltransferase domain-containing protein [Candidatus Nanosalina sp.]